jgi:hypothetical protein
MGLGIQMRHGKVREKYDQICQKFVYTLNAELNT